MSRAATNVPEPIVVAPSNSVYTVLAAVGTLICLIGLAVLYMRASAMGVELLKM